MNKDYVVVLDACVLVGASVRDSLLRLAETPRLYIPKWSDHIIAEVTRTLNVKFGKTNEQTSHLVSSLRAAFPEAWVTGYRSLEAGLENNPKDRHVLACSIRCGAQTIVTYNLKHFQTAALQPFDIEAVHPDEFLVNQFYLDDALVTLKLTEQAAAIGRTLDEQLRQFHRSGQLPLFSQTVADALSIELDPPIQGLYV